MSEKFKLYEIKTSVLTTYVWHIRGTSPIDVEKNWRAHVTPTYDEYEEDEPSDPVIIEIDPADYDDEEDEELEILDEEED